MSEIQTFGVLPALGYGTFRRTGDECLRCTRTAIDVGYPMIDTAAFYENEVEVGRAIAESGARDRLFVTTKVWHDRLRTGEVRRSLEESLKRLGLDHVDLTLIHWPSPDNEPLGRYMTELAEAQDAGLTRHIGVSNFTTGHMNAAAAAIGSERISTNQVELNIRFRNREIVSHCRAMNVPVTAYLPLDKARVVDDARLKPVADRHGATPAQIALAWLLAEGHVAIPSSSNDDRIAENFAAKDIALSDEDMAELDAMGDGERQVDPAWAPKWDDAA